MSEQQQCCCGGIKWQLRMKVLFYKYRDGSGITFEKSFVCGWIPQMGQTISVNLHHVIARSVMFYPEINSVEVEVDSIPFTGDFETCFEMMVKQNWIFAGAEGDSAKEFASRRYPSLKD